MRCARQCDGQARIAIAQAIDEHSIRHELGWSLDQTAEQTGVSKAMLGQIERGESTPTVATLWKIATGLRAPMTTLLEPDREEGGVLLLRDAGSLRVHPSQGGMQHALLFPYEARFGFELYELTFAPHFESISQPHDIGVGTCERPARRGRIAGRGRLEAAQGGAVATVPCRPLPRLPPIGRRARLLSWT